MVHAKQYRLLALLRSFAVMLRNLLAPAPSPPHSAPSALAVLFIIPQYGKLLCQLGVLALYVAAWPYAQVHYCSASGQPGIIHGFSLN